MKTKKIFIALATVSLVTGWAAFIFAQEITGSFVGTVRDSAGASIPGAKVTITDAEKKVVVWGNFPPP